MTFSDAVAISTPCVKTCVLDPSSGLCIGCGRTSDEIAGWTGLQEAERHAIMEGLEARLQRSRSRAARGRSRGA